MQIMVTGTVIVIASAWGVIKFLKPLLGNLPTPKAPATSTDAVVISAALADRETIKAFTHSVDQLRECQRESNVINKMLLEAVIKLTHKL